MIGRGRRLAAQDRQRRADRLRRDEVRVVPDELVGEVVEALLAQLLAQRVHGVDVRPVVPVAASP
jgi:hypothetical protein